MAATGFDTLKVSQDLKAEVFRALWIQGAGIVGIHPAIGGLLFGAIRFLD